MKKQNTIAGLIIAGLSLIAAPCAASVFIPNFSFEDHHIQDNNVSLPSGWVLDAPGSTGGGFINPNEAQFPGAGGDQGPLPAPALGPQAGWLFSAGNSASIATMTSVALGPAQPNTAYILTAAIGNSADPHDGDPQILRLRLLLGGSVVAEGFATGAAIPNGGFLNIQTSFLTGASVTGNLQVQLVHEQPAGLGNEFRYAFCDNVQLVPEPSMAALFCVGLFLVLLAHKFLGLTKRCSHAFPKRDRPLP